MIKFLILIPLIPVLSAVMIMIFGKIFPRQGGLFSIFSVFISFVLSCVLMVQTLTGELILPQKIVVHWFTYDFYPVEAGFFLDGLALIMLVCISAVSLVVQIFSLNFVQKDRYYQKYFVLMSVSTAALLVLVLSEGILLLGMSWWILSICSFIGIGFRYTDVKSMTVARKTTVFMILGDVGLLAGILLCAVFMGTLHIDQIAQHLHNGFVPQHIIPIIAGVLFFCVLVKCAPFPFHLWLSDAMEAHESVAALLFSTALAGTGIYFAARFYFIFAYTPFILVLFTWIGVISALAGGLSALVSNDLRKILIYSSIAEMGLMICGIGIGGIYQGVFYVMTHIFFKASLFCAAALVVRAVGTRDIREMGGLAKRMPATAILFFIGLISLVGIWPSNGFFSKREILLALFASPDQHILFIAGSALLLNAFAAMRLWFLVFGGDHRNVKSFERAEDPTAAVLFPVGILAVFSLLSGWFLYHFHFIDRMLGIAIKRSPTWDVSWIFFALVAAGILFAWIRYQARMVSIEGIGKSFSWMNTVIERDYFLADVYALFVERPVVFIAKSIRHFDESALDRRCTSIPGRSVGRIAGLCRWVEQHIVDRFLIGLEKLCEELCRAVRSVHRGFVQEYMFVAVVAIVVITWIIIG